MYDHVWRRGHRRKQRLQVIEILGGCCVKCGFTDVRALQVDHINGGGSQARKTVSLDSMHNMILRAGNGLGIYQLLCANCNWIKRHENNENVETVFKCRMDRSTLRHRCAKHPRYTGLNKPGVNCYLCWLLWEARKLLAKGELVIINEPVKQEAE